MLVAQAAVYRGAAYRRALAVRRWRALRAVHAPRTTAAIRSTHTAATALCRWAAYGCVLAAAVLPAARLPGVVYVSAFVGFVSLEQGVRAVSGARRRCTRLLLWLLVVLAMLGEIAARFAFAIPYVAHALLAPSTGALGPACNLAPDGSGPSNTTLCGRLLRDLRIGNAAAVATRVELGGLSVLLIIAVQQYREQRAPPPATGAPSPQQQNGRDSRRPRPVLHHDSTAGGGSSRGVLGSTGLHDIPRPAQLARGVAAGCSSLLPTTAVWAVAAHTSTGVLLTASFVCALAYTDAIRFVYLVFAVSACMLGEWAVRGLWLPAGLASALFLVGTYTLQLHLTVDLLDAADAQWIGLSRRGTADGSFHAVRFALSRGALQ